MLLHTGGPHVLVIRLYRQIKKLAITNECSHVLRAKRRYVSADASNYKKESTPFQLDSNLPTKYERN